MQNVNTTVFVPTQADDRRIAEAHYKLSLTLHFLDEPELSLKHARAAVDVCNARIASLSTKVPNNADTAAVDAPSSSAGAADMTTNASTISVSFHSRPAYRAAITSVSDRGCSPV
jgi:hypothetical protein